MHFFYPSAKIFYTSIPKNGSTTLKNLFRNFELGQSGGRPGNPELQGDGMEVHARNEFKSRRSGPREGEVSVIVLRNPWDRVKSVWLNKFLFAQGDYGVFNRYRQEPFSQFQTLSPTSLQTAFGKFVQRLSSHPEFLNEDIHWMPQHKFFDKLGSYSVVCEVSDLEKLVPRLVNFGEAYKAMEGKIQLYNKSVVDDMNFLWTQETVGLVASAYRYDLEIFGEVGLDVTRPTVNSANPAESLRPETVERILTTKLTSADRRLQEVLESRSWRYTRMIRTILRPLKW